MSHNCRTKIETYESEFSLSVSDSSLRCDFHFLYLSMRSIRYEFFFAFLMNWNFSSSFAVGLWIARIERVIIRNGAYDENKSDYWRLNLLRDVSSSTTVLVLTNILDEVRARTAKISTAIRARSFCWTKTSSLHVKINSRFQGPCWDRPRRIPWIASYNFRLIGADCSSVWEIGPS